MAGFRGSAALAIAVALGACSGVEDGAKRAEDWLPAPVTDAAYRPVNMERAELGRLLFYDKILSGNRNISCGTCHHHDHASADGVSLGIGEGGVGVGPARRATSDDERRVPRNAPALFNRGAVEFTKLFHDGRVSVDPTEPSGFDTPAEDFLPRGLPDVLAAQALFPILSEVEMAGSVGENDVAGAARRNPEYAWAIYEQRIAAEPEYVELFRAAFPGEVEKPTDIRIAHVGAALSAFEAFEWRADQSPFDAYLRGQPDALDPAEKRGMELFYGEAGCSGCHAGAFQTDHDFHAVAMPQFGPGRTRRFSVGARDEGRMNETDRLEDAYRFRTPALRNVAATGPYGHDGAYRDLAEMVRHMADPEAGFARWSLEKAALPELPAQDAADRVALLDERERARIRAANEIAPVALSEAQVGDIVAFLHALTDDASLSGRLGRPDAVPSGLPVD